MQRSEEAAHRRSDALADLLIGLFNIALRPQRKAISAAIEERLRTALHDAVAGGDPIYDLLDDLLSAPPIRNDRVTQSFEREPAPAYGDPKFEAWRQQWREDSR